MTELEVKIDKATRVEAYYPKPHITKYAIIEYCNQKNKPLKVASYCIYGEELKTGKPLICWDWRPSMVFSIIENNFNTEEEATARLEELRSTRNETNN